MNKDDAINLLQKEEKQGWVALIQGFPTNRHNETTDFDESNHVVRTIRRVED